MGVFMYAHMSYDKLKYVNANNSNLQMTSDMIVLNIMEKYLINLATLNWTHGWAQETDLLDYNVAVLLFSFM